MYLSIFILKFNCINTEEWYLVGFLSNCWICTKN